MNSESIFNQALALESPTERSRFLDASCAGNLKLRSEIEALLAAHEDAGSFLEKTPEELLAAGATTTPFGGSEKNEPLSATDELPPAIDDSWRELLEPLNEEGRIGRLGSYEIIELVGRGGMGVVLKAHDPRLNRIVAVKLLAPQFLSDPMSVRRFLREAQAAAAVSHDHVVTIFAIDEEARPPMITMEFIEGQSLQQKIDRTGALDVRSILRIGMQTAFGLEAAHRQGLVHRDVKPANILLENGIERVQLTDFGLARAVDDIGMTRTGQITGTPQYMSPEQAQGQRIDHRTDLFSLGCVLYAMCTGRAAFRADSAVAVMHQIVHETPRPIRELNEDIPEWLCEIVERLLAKQADERIPSAQEVGDLLERHLKHLQQPETSPQPERLAPSKSDSADTASADSASANSKELTSLEEEVIPVLRESKTKAIRLYRQRTGAGLADAKVAVEKIAHAHGIDFPKMSPDQRIRQIILTGTLGFAVSWFAMISSASVDFPALGHGFVLISAAIFIGFAVSIWQGDRNAAELPFFMKPQPGFARQVGLPNFVLMAVWAAVTMTVVMMDASQSLQVGVLGGGVILLPLIFLMHTVVWKARQERIQKINDQKNDEPGDPVPTNIAISWTRLLTLAAGIGLVPVLTIPLDNSSATGVVLDAARLLLGLVSAILGLILIAVKCRRLTWPQIVVLLLVLSGSLYAQWRGPAIYRQFAGLTRIVVERADEDLRVEISAQTMSKPLVVEGNATDSFRVDLPQIYSDFTIRIFDFEARDSQFRHSLFDDPYSGGAHSHGQFKLTHGEPRSFALVPGHEYHFSCWPVDVPTMTEPHQLPGYRTESASTRAGSARLRIP